MLVSRKEAAGDGDLIPQVSEAERIERERGHDVRLLLENLFEREEVTVKLILDCLYDVGAAKLINRKFAAQPLNRLMKWIARLSKPAFKALALRWFKRNVPQLLTDWLLSRVKSSVRRF